MPEEKNENASEQPPSVPNSGSIPEDVRLWVAKIRTRLEHVHREPITQNEAHCLLRESIAIAQDHNCYTE